MLRVKRAARVGTAGMGFVLSGSGEGGSEGGREGDGSGRGWAGLGGAIRSASCARAVSGPTTPTSTDSRGYARFHEW